MRKSAVSRYTPLSVMLVTSRCRAHCARSTGGRTAGRSCRRARPASHPLLAACGLTRLFLVLADPHAPRPVQIVGATHHAVHHVRTTVANLQRAVPVTVDGRAVMREEALAAELLV